MTDTHDPRCPWCLAFPEYVRYHDEEWGVPSHDEAHLFEMLILEGAQAGLSWATILKKRAAYRAAFDGFDPEKMARYTPKKIEKLLADPGIVRNRLKVQAAVSNAQAYLKLRDERGGLAPYLWDFVDGEPVVNRFRTLSEVPAQTPVSEAISRDLKKRGFRFVGPTICYAYMQSVGLVNDHLIDCPSHPDKR
ncbi:DNA-3-methyladenine glycosylase I [Thioalkalivibrio sulfidiphilus]|uniref:DNA-3-methyladenine glycosylase I n=1 Tax=Thioalkalivibrio sulfidiphilus (strain HL-EbGR7) TaxID=396588 RepID=B8GMA7_THISH|nr:DNA-3-methyladenine glycosylase I [Thioalkalivibrio sulfidiphilus]ACL73694.1 DNA-3-methyladenine glycosylase I [Thioalkalivibrio sulfidiphilus HL-EbGr7]